MTIEFLWPVFFYRRKQNWRRSFVEHSRISVVGGTGRLLLALHHLIKQVQVAWPATRHVVYHFTVHFRGNFFLVFFSCFFPLPSLCPTIMWKSRKINSISPCIIFTLSRGRVDGGRRKTSHVNGCLQSECCGLRYSVLPSCVICIKRAIRLVPKMPTSGAAVFGGPFYRTLRHVFLVHHGLFTRHFQQGKASFQGSMRSFVRSIDWLIDSIESWCHTVIVDWFIDWFIGILIDLIHRLIEWLIDWLCFFTHFPHRISRSIFVFVGSVFWMIYKSKIKASTSLFSTAGTSSWKRVSRARSVVSVEATEERARKSPRPWSLGSEWGSARGQYSRWCGGYGKQCRRSSNTGWWFYGQSGCDSITLCVGGGD